MKSSPRCSTSALERARTLPRWLPNSNGLCERLSRVLPTTSSRASSRCCRHSAGDPGATRMPSRSASGAIDLLYRDPATNELVIVDYKTDRVEPGAEAHAASVELSRTGRRLRRSVDRGTGSRVSRHASSCGSCKRASSSLWVPLDCDCPPIIRRLGSSEGRTLRVLTELLANHAFGIGNVVSSEGHVPVVDLNDAC